MSYRFFLVGIFCFWLYAPGWSQTGKLDYATAAKVFADIAAGYKGADMVQVNVAAELYYAKQPTRKIDSLQYSIFMQQSNIFVNINQEVAYMQNDKWNVSIFYEDKAILVDSLSGSGDSLDVSKNPMAWLDMTYFDSTCTYFLQPLSGDTMQFSVLAPANHSFVFAEFHYLQFSKRITKCFYQVPAVETAQLQNNIGAPSDTTTRATIATSADDQLIKLYFTWQESQPTNGLLFRESTYFIRTKENVFLPAEQFAGFIIKHN